MPLNVFLHDGKSRVPSLRHRAPKMHQIKIIGFTQLLYFGTTKYGVMQLLTDNLSQVRVTFGDFRQGHWRNVIIPSAKDARGFQQLAVDRKPINYYYLNRVRRLFSCVCCTSSRAASFKNPGRKLLALKGQCKAP